MWVKGGGVAFAGGCALTSVKMEKMLAIAAYLRSWDRYRSMMLPIITVTEIRKATPLMAFTIASVDILPSLFALRKMEIA